MKTNGGFLISRVKQLQGRAFERLLKRSGIDVFNGAQGRILYILYEHAPMTITQISRMTSLAKTTLTSMLERMEDGGLIVRTPDPHNRRQTIVTITDKTRGYWQRYQALSDEMSVLFYKGFSQVEIDLFESQLLRIVDNLTQLEMEGENDHG